MTENERFGLVFVKTGSINSGTGAGMGKKSGSGMNNPDHISDSFETLGFGFGMKNIGMRFKHPGSATFGWQLFDLYSGQVGSRV